MSRVIVAEAWQVYDIKNDPVALSLVGLAWTGGIMNGNGMTVANAGMDLSGGTKTL